MNAHPAASPACAEPAAPVSAANHASVKVEVTHGVARIVQEINRPLEIIVLQMEHNLAGFGEAVSLGSRGGAVCALDGRHRRVAAEL